MKIAGTVDDVMAIRNALSDAVLQIPEENQVYTFEGVTEEGANEALLRIGIVENGEVKAVTAEDLGLQEKSQLFNEEMNHIYVVSMIKRSVYVFYNRLQ